MNRICTICMRGGSKGVPNKNLKDLAGKPLMAYSIEQALQSELFEHVVVSTDSSAIAEMAKSYGAESCFLRPAELATDEAPKIPVIRHAFREAERYYDCKFDILIDLDVTSPLRLKDDIVGAYRQFLEEDADILITGCPASNNPYFNMVERVKNRIEIVKQPVKPLARRQDAPPVYEMNASIYIWKRAALMANDTLFTERTSLYVMPAERSVDIDTELDWEFVEFLIRKKNNSIND